MITGTFTDWLLQQADRDDPVGDLSRDVARDPDWPGSSRSLSRLLVYLHNRGACEGAIAVLRAAWREWQRASA